MRTGVGGCERLPKNANRCRGMRSGVGACELLSQDANRCRECEWLSKLCDWLSILNGMWCRFWVRIGVDQICDLVSKPMRILRLCAERCRACGQSAGRVGVLAALSLYPVWAIGDPQRRRLWRLGQRWHAPSGGRTAEQTHNLDGQAGPKYLAVSRRVRPRGGAEAGSAT